MIFGGVFSELRDARRAQGKRYGLGPHQQDRVVGQYIRHVCRNLSDGHPRPLVSREPI